MLIHVVSLISELSSQEGEDDVKDSFYFYIVVVLSLFIGYIIHFLLYRHILNQPKLPYPPCPNPCHILWGNAIQLPDITKGYHCDPYFLKMAIQLNSPVITIRLPIVNRLIVCADPDLIKQITITKNYNKSQFSYNKLRLMFGKYSILSDINDETWKNKRKIFHKAFIPTKFLYTSIVQIMYKHVHIILDTIDTDIATGNVTNMLSCAQKYTSTVITTVLFGNNNNDSLITKSTTTSEPSYMKVREWLNELGEITARFVQDPVGNLFNIKAYIRSKILERNINQTITIWIKQKQKQLLQQKERQDVNDICSLAIQEMMGNKDCNVLSNKDYEIIVHQLKTLYFAGHDTTATTISYCIWLLSKHPKVYTKLKNEIQQANVWEHNNVNNNNNNNNEQQSMNFYEKLQSCTYLDACIKETLRLYPPAGSARYTNDITASYDNKYSICNSELYISPYVVHRLPQYWGDNANEYIPERFYNIPESTYNTGKFIPFLQGSRDCMGKYFAILGN